MTSYPSQCECSSPSRVRNKQYLVPDAGAGKSGLEDTRGYPCTLRPRSHALVTGQIRHVRPPPLDSCDYVLPGFRIVLIPPRLAASLNRSFHDLYVFIFTCVVIKSVVMTLQNIQSFKVLFM